MTVKYTLDEADPVVIKLTTSAGKVQIRAKTDTHSDIIAELLPSGYLYLPRLEKFAQDRLRAAGFQINDQNYLEVSCVSGPIDPDEE